MRPILRRIIPALAASFLISSTAMAASEIPSTAQPVPSVETEKTVTTADQEAMSNLVAETTEGDIVESEIPAKFSPNRDEASCIALAVFHEARGETYRGQQAVAHAILNRVESPKYPKTACGVVYQKIAGRHQFSFFSKGAAGLVPRQRDMGLWQKAMEIAKAALRGETDPINGAIAFYNPRIGNAGKWARSAAYSIRIGAHVFFRPR